MLARLNLTVEQARLEVLNVEAFSRTFPELRACIVASTNRSDVDVGYVPPIRIVPCSGGHTNPGASVDDYGAVLESRIHSPRIFSAAAKFDTASSRIDGSVAAFKNKS